MQVPALPVHSFLSVSLESWLTIAAIIIGPLAALTIQKWIEDRRARKNRQIQIFRDLMANRASRLAPAYVQALNGIETEFFGQVNVIEAWRVFVDHLYTPHSPDDTTLTRWNDRVTELLTKLLLEMGESLGYHFDQVTLKKNAYYPTGWGQIEAEQNQLRQFAIAVFDGKKSLKVEVVEQQSPSPSESIGTPIRPAR